MAGVTVIMNQMQVNQRRQQEQEERRAREESEKRKLRNNESTNHIVDVSKTLELSNIVQESPKDRSEEWESNINKRKTFGSEQREKLELQFFLIVFFKQLIFMLKLYTIN